MKTRVFAVCGIVLGSTLTAWGQANAPSKVGIINIQAAIIGTKDGQTAAKALEEKSAPKKKTLEGLQNEINALRDKYSKLSSVGSEEEKRRMQADIDQKTKSFNRQVEDAQAELDQEQGRVLNELGGRILAVPDKYAKDNGYAVILDVSAQNTPVLFAANTIDVTQEIIALYDKNAPAGAAVPAATKPAGGTAPGTVAPATTAPGTPAPGATKPAVTPVKPAAPASKPAK